MFETAFYDSDSGFIDLGSPHSAINFARPAEEQEPFENLGSYRNEESALACLLTKVLVVSEGPIAVFVLFESRDLAIKQLESGDCHFLVTVGSEVC